MKNGEEEEEIEGKRLFLRLRNEKKVFLYLFRKRLKKRLFLDCKLSGDDVNREPNPSDGKFFFPPDRGSRYIHR